MLENRKPEISVIIPIGPDRKMEAMNYLKNQTVPVEIIVEKGKNPSLNRNSGVEKASSEIIAFINAHSLPTRDWAEKIVGFFSKYINIDIVGGPQLTAEKESYIGKISGYALSSVFGAADVSTRYSVKKLTLNADEKLLTSSNLAIRREVAREIKFDEKIYPGEDPKFISDAKKAGFKVAYSPEIYIHHRRRSTIKEFAQQIFNYGEMRPKKESFFETAKKPSFLIPAFFTIYLAIFSVLSLIHAFFVFPLLLYVILLILFSIYESYKNRDFSGLIILPFIFFTIHISYGLGFIYGTFHRILK